MANYKRRYAGKHVRWHYSVRGLLPFSAAATAREIHLIQIVNGKFISEKRGCTHIGGRCAQDTRQRESMWISNHTISSCIHTKINVLPYFYFLQHFCFTLRLIFLLPMSLRFLPQWPFMFYSLRLWFGKQCHFTHSPLLIIVLTVNWTDALSLNEQNIATTFTH